MIQLGMLTRTSPLNLKCLVANPPLNKSEEEKTELQTQKAK